MIISFHHSLKYTGTELSCFINLLVELLCLDVAT